MVALHEENHTATSFLTSQSSLVYSAAREVAMPPDFFLLYKLPSNGAEVILYMGCLARCVSSTVHASFGQGASLQHEYRPGWSSHCQLFPD